MSHPVWRQMVDSRKFPVRRGPRFRPRLEVLEDRLAPATLDVSAGTLTFTGDPGESNVLDVSLAGNGDITFDDLNDINLTPGAVAAGFTNPGGDTEVATGPTAGLTNIIINLGDADDDVTLGSFQASLGPTGLVVNGGPGEDFATVGFDGNGVSAGAVEIGDFDEVTLENDLTSATNVTLTNVGTLDVQEAATLTATNLDLGAADVNLADDLNLDVVNAVTIAGALTGAGTLALDVDAPNVTLSGNSPGFTGTVAVNRAILAVNGDLSSGTVSINSIEGALTGTGNAGDIVLNGGFIQPGTDAGPGTLNAQSLTVVGLGGQIGVRLAATANDMLNVAGPANLGNGLMFVEVDLVDSFAPDAGDKFTFLNATNVTGSFNNQTDTADGLTFDIGTTATTGFAQVQGEEPEPEPTPTPAPTPGPPPTPAPGPGLAVGFPFGGGLVFTVGGQTGIAFQARQLGGGLALLFGVLIGGDVTTGGNEPVLVLSLGAFFVVFHLQDGEIDLGTTAAPLPGGLT